MTYHLVTKNHPDAKKQDEPDTRTETAKADSELAIDVHRALLDNHDDKPVTIPPQSTLGLWFSQFRVAVYSQPLTRFFEKNRFDGDELYFHPRSNSVTGRFMNQDKEIKLAGGDEEPAILGLIMAAVTVIDSGEHQGLSTAAAYKSTLPLKTVLAFYDVDRNDPDAIAALGRDKAFAPVKSPQRIKSDKARGTRTLLTHQRLVGDIYDRRSLNLHLQGVINGLDAGKFDGQPLLRTLEETQMYLSPGSSYSQAHHCPEDTLVSLAQFIQASGRPLPKTREELVSLQRELSANAEILLEDALLATSYSRAVQQQPKPAVPPRIEVPAHSVMGAWLTLYRSHLEQPVVIQWMRDQGIDPATVLITPATGTLSAQVNGLTKHFSLEDDSGWRTIASPLIAAAKVIAPGTEQQLARPVGNPAFTATAQEIGAFYDEEPNPGTARLATLKAQGGFDFPAPDSPVQLTSRSLKSLERHEQIASAHYETLAKAAADKARATREKTRYTQLLSSTNQTLPVVRNEAKKWAEKLILEQEGWTVDADKIFLNRFDGTASSAVSATGWEHLEEEPSSSLRLPDALLRNFNEKDQVPGELDLRAGLYKVGKGHSKEGYGLHNQFPMAPSKLMKASWKTDFQAQFTQQMETFWKEHGDDYRTLLKGEFVHQARQQLKGYESASPQDQRKLPAEQRFTRDDYRLVMGAAPDLPLDENQPLTVDNLKAESAPAGTVKFLEIRHFLASDILHFVAGDDGAHSKEADRVQILYVPGQQPAFLRFKSQAELDDWVSKQQKDPARRDALNSHLSLTDRQLLENGKAELIDTPRVDGKIEHDVFRALRTPAQRRMDSDADVTIKSNSEVTRDTWLNDMTAAAGLLGKFAAVGEPLVVAAAVATGITELALGAEKSASGDTNAERRQGASAAIDGTLNTLFSALSVSDGAAEDPFAVRIEPGSTATFVPVAAHPPAKPAIALRTETFADGTRALTTETPLSERAYTLPGANGFDVIDEDRVYRYNAEKPGVLTDLQAVDDYKELEEFEAYCPAPPVGRARRGVSDLCFVRTVNEVEGELPQELQALEHTRLRPSPAKLFNRERFTLFEKRLYKVADNRLVSVPNNGPIRYKNAIRGSVITDKHFGLYGSGTHPFLEEETRVVKLGAISDACNDSRDVRGVVVPSPIKGDATKYLVVEADVGEFYYAKLDNLKKPDALFIKAAPNDFDKALAKRYRNKLYLRQKPAGMSIDNKFIALPKLDEVYKDLEKAGYAKSDIAELKARCNSMTAEQKREVAYQLQQRGATGKADIALSPADVRPVIKPANFNSLGAEQQNAFYARQALQTVQKDLKASGLGPGNVVRSATDLARADAANSVVKWLRQTRNPQALTSGRAVVKAGAGNCGEMAVLSRDIINSSGGRAYEWFAGDSHAFTVVGGPSIKPAGTVDFAGPQWAHAWVVDPWVGIACPASEYTQRLEQTMRKWTADGWTIREGTNMAMSPTDKQWLDTLIREPKEPYSHGYPPEPAPEAAAESRAVMPRPLPVAEKVEVSMGYSHTVKDNLSILSTRYLSDCSALAVLTDLKDGVYQTRTLMHLTGSNLELGLLDQNTYPLLDTLNTSLAKGGKVIFVGGLESQSPVGMGIVLGQEHNGRKPLLDILRKPGVETVIAGSSGIDINPDGTFKLMESRGKGVFDQAAIKDVMDFAD